MCASLEVDGQVEDRPVRAFFYVGLFPETATAIDSLLSIMPAGGASGNHSAVLQSCWRLSNLPDLGTAGRPGLLPPPLVSSSRRRRCSVAVPTFPPDTPAVCRKADPKRRAVALSRAARKPITARFVAQGG